MKDLLARQKAFYEERYKAFGDDPRSLSYNSIESQRLRFRVLAELFRHEAGRGFSIHEAGCGLAHFNEFLQTEGPSCTYSGSDIYEPFIEASRAKFPDSAFVLQDMSVALDRIHPAARGSDYYVVSGTFNPINDCDPDQWEAFVFRVVNNMFALAGKGIAFNLLTTYVDYRDDQLYYADPRRFYDWCKTNLSRFVTVVSDYALYEFSVLVYKPAFVRSLHTQEFERYFSSSDSDAE